MSRPGKGKIYQTTTEGTFSMKRVPKKNILTVNILLLTFQLLNFGTILLFRSYHAVHLLFPIERKLTLVNKKE